MKELHEGPRRPSDIMRSLPGLTQKVLSERLRKLERYGLLDRQAFAEVPPRVEYRLTAHGNELAELVGELTLFIEAWSGSNT